MTVEEVIGGAVVVVIGIIGYFLKNLIARQEQDVKTSRSNERELYKEIARIELSYWKDQCEQARKSIK